MTRVASRRPLLLALLAATTGLVIMNELKKEDPRRALVVGNALSKLGVKDSTEFWADALAPGTSTSDYPKDWCGGFALWAIHGAGLGLDLNWRFQTATDARSGFLIPNLRIVKKPEPGDVAYFEHNQHHAIVESFDPNTGLVHLINGNGANGMVTQSTVPIGGVTAFFSLDPLLRATPASESV